MKNLSNELTRSPMVFQITSRLETLIITDSRPEVEACLVMTFSNRKSKQVILQRHLNNLLLSFESHDIKDALEIMGFLKVLQKTIKKVG